MTPVATLFISVFTYLFMGIVMYSLGLKSYKLSNRSLLSQAKTPFSNKFFFFSILFFALMCGLRYRCGADCEGYARGLERLIAGQPFSSYKDSNEFLFEAIAKFMAWLRVGRVFYMGVWAFIEIFFFYSALKTRNYLLPFVGVVLILGPHFSEWNNGLRQMIAATIFVYGVVGLIDGKPIWKYFLWIFIAYLFHQSALILIPFVLLKFTNLKPRFLLSALLLLLSVYLGQSGVFEFAFKNVENVLSILNYEDYANRFDDIMMEEATISTYGPRRLVLLLSNFLIIYFSPKLDDSLNGDKFFRVSFFLFLVYSCASELFIGHDIVLLRPFLYFMPFLLISSAFLLYYLKRINKRIWYVIAIVLFCSFSLLNSIASYMIPDETDLYKFIFLK